MRFQLPMYEGDSFLRPGPEADSRTLKSPQEPHSTPEMLQRKIAPVEADLLVLDHFEIERRARALRAAAIRSAAASFWGWVERLFETARRRRVEEYLAGARSVAELEARLRKLERHGHLLRV